jgi:hypothetical protein
MILILTINLYLTKNTIQKKLQNETRLLSYIRAQRCAELSTQIRVVKDCKKVQIFFFDVEVTRHLKVIKQVKQILNFRTLLYIVPF